MSTQTAALNAAKYHRIGVVSLMGYEVQAKSVGWWAFANKSWNGDAREWEMNKFTKEVMMRSLQRRGFQPVALDYDSKAWFERLKKKTQGFTLSGIFSAYGGDVTSTEFAAEFKGAAQREKLDALLVFVPGRDTVNQTGEAWIGVGDTGMGFRAAGEQAISPYTMGFLYLIDANTLTAIRRLRFQAWGATLRVRFPADWAAMPPSERDQLRAAFCAAFSDELEPALGQL